MCVVSMVGDHFTDKWREPYFPKSPWDIPYTPQRPYQEPYVIPQKPKAVDWEKYFNPPVTKKEFDELKKEVEEMKKLLQRAKEYDEKNNEPNCEIEDKMALLRIVAKFVGIDLDEILKPQIITVTYQPGNIDPTTYTKTEESDTKQ